MPKKIASRVDWLNLGISLLATKGSSSLIVEKMAKSLGVSKTSFYWHFKTKKKYILDLTKFWASTQTDSIIEEALELKNDREKLFHLAETVFIYDHSLNPLYSLRELAKKDIAIARIIAKTENHRIDYVQKLLCSEFGKKEAGYRADVLYHYFLGWIERHRERKIDEDEFNTICSNILIPMVTNTSKKIK